MICPNPYFLENPTKYCSQQISSCQFIQDTGVFKIALIPMCRSSKKTRRTTSVSQHAPTGKLILATRSSP